MNHPWFYGIIFGRILFSLVAIILVIILYPVLHNEIDLKRWKVVALFSFGIRARKEELVLPPSLLTFWEYLIIFRRLYLIIDQQLVKNIFVKPSGPGALSGFMIAMASFNSFMVTGGVRKLFSSVLMRWGMRSNGWEEVSSGSSMGAVNNSLKVANDAFFMPSESLISSPWKFISETAL